MKKKLFTMLLALTLTASCLTACGDSSTTDSSSADSSSAAETTTTTTSAITTTTTTTTTTTAATAPTRQASELFEDTFLYLIPPNSANGIQFLFGSKYTGTKRIKYYTIAYQMYNAVDDPAYDTIQNKSGFVKRTVGPVDPNHYIIDMSKDRPSVYCGTCDKLVVEKILLEYMDGTEEAITFQFPGHMWSPQSDYFDDWSMVYSKLKSEHPDFST